MESDDTNSEANFAEDNSSVRVALRIRPCLPREVIEGCKTCTTVSEHHPQVWIGSNHAFTYDYVFDQNSAQDAIFDQVVKQLIEGCMRGYNATILAYGQTGSGKTYTMGTGFEYDPSAEAQGIIPRSVTYLFGEIDKLRKEDFEVKVNFVELYNEEVIDLLSQTSMRVSTASSRPNSANPIRIHEDTNGSIYLVGVQAVSVSSCHETLKILREGALSRTTASTNMNDTSSRSHAIFTINVTQTKVSNAFGEEETDTLSAKFHFVDLAGSERLKRTMATGDRAKEGISINCGLLALGNVISALGDKNRKSSHVPYRDSKLTRLLQDSLGGNSRTIMIACVSPSDRDFVETLNTLKYANRARNIKNKVQINQDKSSRTIASLRRHIEELETELVEYKQGKRAPSDSAEYKDTYQENMLLLAEIESLKSRLKSKQESIDKLTSTIACQKTEEELKNFSSGVDCDLTNMIQKYILEIEDLRTKLYEAEEECQRFKSKQRLLNTSLSSPRKQLFVDTVTGVNSNILGDARIDIQNDKKRLELLSKDNESDNSSSDSEEQENLEEIVQLSSEINVKERLIEELEASQKRMENMKRHYEEKLDCLFSKVKAIEQERDKVLSSLKSGTRSAQVNADYEKKLANMQSEIKKWQSLQKEHAVQVKQNVSTSRQLDKLKSEVENLKQTKVKLQRQAKMESARFRELELKRQKEIISLKKAQRVKDIQLKTLENDKRMKEQVLKRKHEEVNSLKRQNKQMMSRKAQGKRAAGSPVKAKSKWNTLQHQIRKSVSIKSTVYFLEKEMLNLIQERTEARKRLEDLESVLMKDELIDDDIENVKINLNFLEERITEIQNQIAELSSGIKELDSTEYDDDEMQYVFKKVFEMNVMNSTDLERSERRVDDLEETVKQQNKEISSLRDLLHHMYRRRSLQDDDDVPELPPPSSVIEFQDSNSGDTPSSTKNIKIQRKARRLTSTPQELLGSLENVSKPDFLNPNDLQLQMFSRATRQTQSLRIPSARGKRKPVLQRQDTYNVADKNGESLDPPEKLLTQTNRNGNTRDFNATFIIESPPAPPTASSSASCNLLNSLDETFLCDNATNTNNVLNFDIKKGIIRRVSNGVRDKVLNFTHSADGHSKPVISMCATELRLFTGSKDSTAIEFDLNKGVGLNIYKGHPNNVQCVYFVESEETLITASSYIVKLWDTRTATCQKTLTSSGISVEKISCETRLLPYGEFQIQSLTVLRNYLFTTCDNRIRVWDRRNLNSPIGILAGKHSSSVMCLASAENISMNGATCDIVASGAKDHYIKLYCIKPEQTLGSVQPRKNLDPPHYDGIQSLLIKGSELYSGSRDTCIKRWDMCKEEMICCASNAHAGWITGLSQLPSSSSLDYILSASRDGSVKVWDRDLKEVLKVDVGQMFQQPNYSVESLCVNSRLVFTAGGATASNNNNFTNASVREYGVGCWDFNEKLLIDSRNNNNRGSPP